MSLPVQHRPAASDPRTAEAVTFERVDAAVRTTGLLLRAIGYAAIGGVAAHYDCGQAILTGLLFGDLAGSLAGLVVRHGQGALQGLAELALLGIVLLWVRADLTWPDDQALRAIAGLSALGVFAGRLGGNVLTRFGHD